MCHLSNTQGTLTLHIGRKLWYVIKNFNAVRYLDQTKMNISKMKEVIKYTCPTEIARFVSSLGETLSGLGVEYWGKEYGIIYNPVDGL